MPVEIRELVIQAQLDTSVAQQKEKADPTAVVAQEEEEEDFSAELEEMRASILAECKDYIRQQLEERRLR